MSESFQKWIKRNKTSLTIYIASFVFIALCGIFIRFEKIWFIYSVFLLIALYIIFFHTDKALYIAALLTPLSIKISEKISNVSADISIPAEFMLICIMLMFLLKIIYNKDYPKEILKHPISIALYVYIGWIFITALTSTMPVVSIKYLICKLWFIIPCYFYLSELIYKDSRNFSRFIFCYALGLGIVICITTVKHIQLGAVEKVAHWVMSPYYNDHTAYGAVLAFFLCLLPGFAFSKSFPARIRILSKLLLILCLTGLILSYCRAAWVSVIIAIFVSIIILLKIKFKIVAIATIILVSITGVFFNDIIHELNKNETESSKNIIKHIQSISNISSDASNVERLNRWSSALKMFKQKPIFGWGPGTYQFQYAPFQNPKYKTIITTNSGNCGNAHSEYLGLLSETGFIGSISLIVLIILNLISGIRVYRKTDSPPIHRLLCFLCVSAIVSYFSHGFFNNFLDTDKLAVPVFGVMAVIAVLDIKNRHTK